MMKKKQYRVHTTRPCGVIDIQCTMVLWLLALFIYRPQTKKIDTICNFMKTVVQVLYLRVEGLYNAIMLSFKITTSLVLSVII